MRNSEHFTLWGVRCVCGGIVSGYQSLLLLAVGLWCLAINARNRESAAEGVGYDETLIPIPLQLPPSLTATPRWLALILVVALRTGGILLGVRDDLRLAGLVRGAFDIVCVFFFLGAIYALVQGFVRTAQEVRVQTAVDTFTPSATPSPLSRYLHADGEMDAELARAVHEAPGNQLPLDAFLAEQQPTVPPHDVHQSPHSGDPPRR